MIYTLSVDVGKSGVAPQYYSTTRMEVGGIDAADYRPLEAGVFLANDEPNAGEWSTWVRQWTTGADSAALGMPLAVLIVGGGGIQTLFDNVRLEATLLTTFIAGDFSGDGVVDQADLDLVLLNWGGNTAEPPTGWLALELLAGEVIDQSELDLVLLNWGNTAGAASSGTLTTTPEPSSLMLAALAVATLLVRRRRAHGRS